MLFSIFANMFFALQIYYESSVRFILIPCSFGTNLFHFIKDFRSLTTSTILFSVQGNGENNDNDHY